MRDGKGTFNVLASIEKHIKALKPLLPKQALVCIGEYPIKIALRDPAISKEAALPILIEKSSDEIYKWLPKGVSAKFVLGFEEEHIDTHFWYNVLPTIWKNNSVIESLKTQSIEKLQSAIIFSSVWDGIGSASLPALIEKFKTANMDTLSMAVLPSKIQPNDAHFNAYASLKMCMSADEATVLLLDRDQIEGFEGVDRKGEVIKGNVVVNYLLNLFLAKDTLVKEISELSRTFNIKLFTPIVVAGASQRIYGSLENMLNTAILKPFLTFDLSSASLLFVLLRMPSSLKDKLSKGEIELAITNWFRGKTALQSIYISEPIYTEDMTDRIDAVLLVGGFDIAPLFGELDKKVEPLKNKAVERGLMTEDWKVEFEVEEPPKLESIKLEEQPATIDALPLNIEGPNVVAEVPDSKEKNSDPSEIDLEEVQTVEEPPPPVEKPIAEEPQILIESGQVTEKLKTPNSKRTRRTKKASTPRKRKEM